MMPSHTRPSGRETSRRLLSAGGLSGWALGGLMLAATVCGSASAQSADSLLPHLREQGSTRQLIVDGSPFLILGGELGNSSASSEAYIGSLWSTLEALRLNTVLAPVYWELIEPEEGVFDFSLVDDLIDGARAHDMRLVLLWFGSWKNSMSSYVPSWVKTDQDRFPRAQRSDGTGLEILSPLSEANREADAAAFAALMRHLREVDGETHTVIMVQVENEIGMIPEARDHSAVADAAYAGPVPRELMGYLEEHRDTLMPALNERWVANGMRRDGSWEDVFGQGIETEEFFTAWHFGEYVETVAAAGKAEYPLPMFVNAALFRPGYEPGRYPGGGPLPHLIDIWRAAAPSIDFLAPDIYFPNFVEWTTAYAEVEQPLFIPEAGRAGEPEAAAEVFYAIGAHDAIGFSPFSIESISEPADEPLRQAYELLHGLSPVILEHQGFGTMTGVLPPVAFDGTVDRSPAEVVLGGYRINVSFEDPWTPDDEAPSGGIIIATGDDEFLVAGTGVTLTFQPDSTDGSIAGILSAQEGTFEEGEWVGGRWLNGDQTHQGRHIRIAPWQFQVQRVRLYRYH